jgi:undecaprenyl-diphosphatase
MDLLHAILLGLVQGLTEFLPISSSGHLVFAQNLLGIREPNVAFDLILHLGTLLAVLVYFRNDIVQIFTSACSQQDESGGRRWIAMIVLGTIPTALIGFAFQQQFESLFGKPRLVAMMLWITAALLFLSDRVRSTPKQIGKITALQAIVVGIAQGLAIIPGISRSGATITTGLFTGMDAKTSARFSFLLAVPAILGASTLELKGLPALQPGEFWSYLGGAVVAFISGWIAIDLLLKVLVRRKLWKFSLYLLLLGAIGLIFL